MPRFFTCRFVVRPHEKSLTKKLCLAWTVDGVHCQAHIEAAKIDAAHADAIAERFMRQPVSAPAPVTQSEPEGDKRYPCLPRWPGTEDGLAVAAPIREG